MEAPCSIHRKTKWGKRDESISDLHVYLHLGLMPLFLGDEPACIKLSWEMLLQLSNTRVAFSTSSSSSSRILSLSEDDVYPRLTALC